MYGEWDKSEKGKEYYRSRQRGYTQVILHFQKESDADIIKWLNEQDNKTGYIRELIKADMKKRLMVDNLVNSAK